MKKIMIETAALIMALSALFVFSACSACSRQNGENVSTTSAANSTCTTAVTTENQTEPSSSTPGSSEITTLQTVGTEASASSITDSLSSATRNGTEQTVAEQTVASSLDPSQTIAYYSEYNDTRLAKYFKGFDMKNIYIKVLTEKKDGSKATREYASKNDAVYSSLEDGEDKIIYLSNNRVTFSLDVKEKRYTLYSIGALTLEYIYSGCIGAGECDFNGQKCTYEAFYDNYLGNIVCHMFNQKGVWVGYEEYEGAELIQTNYVNKVSKDIPTYIFFEIPSDYKYYYEENIVTIPSGWFD